jgi:hypothetical protein
MYKNSFTADVDVSSEASGPVRGRVADGLLKIIRGAGILAIAALAGCKPGADGATAQVTPPANFSGIWVIADPALAVVPEANVDNLTDAAKERIARYQTQYDPSVDDPSSVCLAKGMPWTMLNRARDYLTEIYQTNDRVTVFFELYDAYRHIRMDRTEFPDYVAPSSNGYSIAKWEGSTLAIETRGVIETNPVSHVHRGPDLRIIEKWSLQQDETHGEVLVVDMTIHDPLIYKQPAEARFVMKRAEEGEAVGGYNCPNYLWDKFVEKRTAELEAKAAKKG